MHVPLWSSLNRVGRSRVLRSSYFWLFAVPLCAHLLAKTGSQINIPLWKSTLTITLGLPFSWKMFYFSSVAFAAASFLYSTQCPSLVRDYDRFSDFADQGKGARHIVQELVVIRSKFSSTDVHFRKWFIDRFALEPGAVGNDLQRMLDMDIPKHKLADAFWWVREHADQTKPMVRATCSFCYVIGFVLIFLVLCQNFYYVCRFSV